MQACSVALLRETTDILASASTVPLMCSRQGQESIIELWPIHNKLSINKLCISVLITQHPTSLEAAYPLLKSRYLDFGAN